MYICRERERERERGREGARQGEIVGVKGRERKRPGTMGRCRSGHHLEERERQLAHDSTHGYLHHHTSKSCGHTHRHRQTHTDTHTSAF